MKQPQQQKDDPLTLLRRNWQLALIALIGVLAMIPGCVLLLGE
jgi:hypothetical protein